MAAASRRFVIVADVSKEVGVLGAFPLPVEIVPFAWQVTVRRLSAFGCSAALRMRDGTPFVTDNGNYIADCAFGSISDPGRLQEQLKLVPGVVETGLFAGMADLVVIGSPTDVKVRPRVQD